MDEAFIIMTTHSLHTKANTSKERRVVKGFSNSKMAQSLREPSRMMNLTVKHKSLILMEQSTKGISFSARSPGRAYTSRCLRSTMANGRTIVKMEEAFIKTYRPERFTRANLNEISLMVRASSLDGITPMKVNILKARKMERGRKSMIGLVSKTNNAWADISLQESSNKINLKAKGSLDRDNQTISTLEAFLKVYQSVFLNLFSVSQLIPDIC